MEISNNIQISQVQTNTTVKPKEQKAVNQENNTKSIELPDIRSSQIWLPDNKIYVPQQIVLPKGSMPADFNTTNITVEVPKHYEPSEKAEKLEEALSKIFKNEKVAVYNNKKTGDVVMRMSKNNFNEDGVLDSSEVTEISAKNKTIGIKYIKDYENNTETEIIQRNPLDRRNSSILTVTTVSKDENGKMIKSEEYKKSPYLMGVFDITETDAEGNKKIIAQTTKREDGSIIMERNLVSLDGTKTHYVYETDADEKHKKMFCQITDKDGKVLSTIDRTYDKESDTVTRSSLNGNQYKIEKNAAGIEVTDYTKGETTQIDTDKFKAKEESKALLMLMGGRDRNFSNQEVTDVLFDTLPADTLLTLNANIKEILPLEDDLDSAFVGTFDYLMCKTNNFVINHELGHSKDAVHFQEDENLLEAKPKDVIASQPEFRKLYIEEKSAFIKAFPDFEEKFISYFINSPESKPQRGRKETVAESNAINGLQPKEPEVIAMRTIILQRYFPKTMAMLTNMMNPIAHAEQEVPQEKE
ncbi:MAG: hypothetical protein K6C94_08730 [Candidatus Gastranaerophilales bacterium]|nr:hypothetical protein [Candidatus Gastranaerophilales bacterium]